MPDVDFRLGQGLTRSLRAKSRATSGSRVSKHILRAAAGRCGRVAVHVRLGRRAEQLLEVAMTGIPVDGSLVDGTGEVLSAADSWPAEPGRRRQRLREGETRVLAVIRDCSAKALQMRERLLRKRTRQAYSRQAARRPSRAVVRVGLIGDRPLLGGDRPRREAVCGPTMDAADLAVSRCSRARVTPSRRSSGSMQPTEATSAYFHQPLFRPLGATGAPTKRDLGRVRNALLPECEGR